MKKILFIMIALLSFWGCVSDDTNENFSVLNEATISGIEDEYNEVFVDEVFSIRPTVETTLNDDSKFSYFWIAYDKNTYIDADTLSKEKNLNVTIRLTPGEHTLKFKAVDTTTGIFYEKEFIVKVVNEYTNGLLILSDNEGEAVLNFWIPGKDEVATDLYSKFNDDGPLGRNPKRVYFNKYTDENACEVLVMCQDGEGGKVLNSITMVKDRDYKDFFMSLPEQIVPEAYYKNGMREYLVDNGLIYDRAVNSFTPVLTVKPNMSVVGKTYRIADNADFGDDEDTPSRTVVYDNENQCFYAIYSITTAFLTTVKKTSGFTYVDGGYFNPDNVGMTCVYANISARSETGAKEYMGIFETSSGERHLLKMGIGFWVEDADPSTYFKDMGDDVLTCEGIAEATTFACSARLSGYMFYAAGSAVYVYNSADKTSKKIYDFGANFTVNHMEMERGNNRLWVAFQDNSATGMKGGFAGLTIETDGGLHLEESVRHDHIAGRIVDFESKY
jgi:hypothetical protein